MKTFAETCRAFGKNRNGGVAIVLAFSAVALLGVAGLAVDYSNASKMKGNLYAAADAASLAAARLYGSAAERETLAKKVFDANVAGETSLTSIVMTPTNLTREGTNYGYRVAATAKVKTNLGGVVGIPELSLAVMAEANGSISTSTEISMVLDTTYSMTGWKINTLKTAAARLVDDLKPLAVTSEALKIAVVPFSQYVNIGVANRNQPWMDVPADWMETGKNCWKTADQIGTTNCRMVDFPATPATPGSPGSPPGTCYNDGVPYSCGGSGPTPGQPARPGYSAQVCDPIYGPQKEVCNTWEVWHRFHGCAGSRNDPLNTKDDSYGTRIPGLMDIHCGTQMVPLTTNLSDVKSTINALTPNGETYIPSGLIWGWRTLSAKAPFTAKTGTETSPVRKFLILMTDGLNTKSPNFPKHEAGDAAKANDYLVKICNNIKADVESNITIFSVAFDVNDAATKKMLKDCALNTKGQFFDARNSSEFLAAFSNIGSVISELRLTK